MARSSSPPAAATWWAQRPPREQRLLLAAALLLGAALLWTQLLAPAWRTVRSFEAQRSALDTQQQRMLQLQAQAQRLQALPALDAQGSQQALQRAVTEVLGAQGSLQVQGNVATVTLRQASPEALAQWLARTRTSARLVPHEAQLQRSPQGWSGTVRLLLGPT
jgi:general secretion pathway protein M